ncbi:MAG: Xaa-Pro peptidase family protein [Acidimicrobiia bacterium]|nr:Xaa-Pro peptidase family protein [Acidimicrobiia bacterium]
MYAERMAGLRQEMTRAGVDVALLSLGFDLPYLTGYAAMPLERITMLVVRPDDATLVVPALEAPRVVRHDDLFEVRPWGETEDPLDLIAYLAGMANTVAVGEQTWAGFVLGLQARLPLARWVGSAGLTRSMRMRKSPFEIDALRAVAHAADEVAMQIAAEPWAGRSERNLARRIHDLLIGAGHDAVSFTIVASGPHGASPHHEPGGRTITPGDVVVCDFGGVKDGYCSDTTRTFAVGEPTAEIARAHASLLEAQQAAVAGVAPGVTAGSVDRVARRILTGSGFGEFFIHRTGHGIGLDVHEEPYIVEGNDLVLEPGMAFSIEPGIYMPDRWGMRIEDIVVVTDDGVEVLNRSERSLVVVA